MKPGPLHLVLSLLVFTASLIPAADFVLVSKDLPPAPIIVFKDAPPLTRAAVEELADSIEKTCGRRPQVLDGAPEPLPERAVWIGVQPAVKTLFPEVSLDFQHHEEIVIAIQDKHVLIAGRDRWDPALPMVKIRDEMIKGAQQEYGTANAIYTFLQDQMGVRWFWPGEVGEDILKREEVTLSAPFSYRYHPQIRARGGVFNQSDLGNKGYGRSHTWTRRQRLQLSSLEIEGGHGFGDWWERYHEPFPEIFALQPDGTRSGFPNPRTAKLCMTNPKVAELWLEGVEERLAQNPQLTVFNASPNDSWASGHCVCEKCRSLDHPEGEPRLFHWYKSREVRPALSDRDVKFANHLGRLLEARYPGKNYRVMMLSYGQSRPVPVEARPASNVIMCLVANFLGRTELVDSGSTRGDTYRQQFEGWAKILNSMFWRPNTGSPAGWQQGLPDLTLQQTVQDFKDVAAAGCEGIFIDTVWENWATTAPQYYLMGQLAWNPGADAPSLLDDFYARAFGPAAGDVREYFEALEQARAAFMKGRQETEKADFLQLYTDALLAESQARLDKARAAVPADSLHAKRVAFIQTGLDYSRLQLANIRLMENYWPKKDPQTAAQVKENWKQIEALAAATPEAMGWSSLRPARPRTEGLHPDDPAPKKKKKKVQAKDLDLN